MAVGTPSPRRPAVPLSFRRNVDRLTARQLAILRRAFDKVMAIADDRGYGRWAGEHGLPFPTECDFAHRRPYFLTWHRAYLWRFERALRDQEPEAMLGWWDWRTGRIPPAFDQAEVEGQPNPLFAAEINPVAVEQAAQAGRPVPPVTQRQPGRPGTRLPTAQQVRDLLALSDFASFNNELENLHDSVHVWVGGHMSNIGFSSRPHLLGPSRHGRPPMADMAASPSRPHTPGRHHLHRHGLRSHRGPGAGHDVPGI